MARKMNEEAWRKELAKRLRALFSWNHYIVHQSKEPHMGKVEETKALHITGVSLTESSEHREYWERIIAKLERPLTKKRGR